MAIKSVTSVAEGQSNNTLIYGITDTFRHSMIQNTANAQKAFSKANEAGSASCDGKAIEAAVELKNLFKTDSDNINRSVKVAKTTQGVAFKACDPYTWLAPRPVKKDDKKIAEEIKEAKVEPLGTEAGLVLSMDLKALAIGDTADIESYTLQTETKKVEDKREKEHTLRHNERLSFTIECVEDKASAEGHRFRVKRFGGASSEYSANLTDVRTCIDNLHLELKRIKGKVTSLISNYKTIQRDPKLSRGTKRANQAAYSKEYEALVREFELLYKRAALPLADFYISATESRSSGKGNHKAVSKEAFLATKEILNDTRNSFYKLQLSEIGDFTTSRQKVNQFMQNHCKADGTIDASDQAAAIKFLHLQKADFQKLYKFFTSGMGRFMPLEKRFELLVPLEHNIRVLNNGLISTEDKVIIGDRGATQAEKTFYEQLEDVRTESKTFFKGQSLDQLIGLLETSKSTLSGQSTSGRKERALLQKKIAAYDKVVNDLSSRETSEKFDRELFGTLHDPVIYSLIDYTIERNDACQKAESDCSRSGASSKALMALSKRKTEIHNSLVKPILAYGKATNGDEILRDIFKNKLFYDMYRNNKHLLPKFYRDGILDYYVTFYNKLEQEIHIAEEAATIMDDLEKRTPAIGDSKGTWSLSLFGSDKTKDPQAESTKRAKDLIIALGGRSSTRTGSSKGIFSRIPFFGSKSRPTRVSVEDREPQGLDPNIFPLIVEALSQNRS